MNSIFDLEFGPVEEESEQGFGPLLTHNYLETILNFQQYQNKNLVQNEPFYTAKQSFKIINTELEKVIEYGYDFCVENAQFQSNQSKTVKTFRKKYRIRYECDCGREWVKSHQNVTVLYQVTTQDDQLQVCNEEVNILEANNLQANARVFFVLGIQFQIAADTCQICESNINGSIIEKDLILFSKRFCVHVSKMFSKMKKTRKIQQTPKKNFLSWVNQDMTPAFKLKIKPA